MAEAIATLPVSVPMCVLRGGPKDGERLPYRGAKTLMVAGDLTGAYELTLVPAKPTKDALVGEPNDVLFVWREARAEGMYWVWRDNATAWELYLWKELKWFRFGDNNFFSDSPGLRVGPKLSPPHRPPFGILVTPAGTTH